MLKIPDFIRLRLQGLSYRLSLAGIETGKVRHTLGSLASYWRDRRRFYALQGSARDAIPAGMDCWCLHDRLTPCGATSSHYFHQDLHVARRIFAARPCRHIDVGSRVDGFVAHVATFREVEVVDIRPPPVGIPGIRFIQADLMKPLPALLVGSADSLSCLHALEHFGLGRYGDPLDPDGHLLGLTNLETMLMAGGRLYLSLPMGPSRVEFNAHRVFSLPHLVRLLAGRFTIERFSFVDDQGRFHDDQPWTGSEAEESYGCRFGCAIIEGVKASSGAAVDHDRDG